MIYINELQKYLGQSVTVKGWITNKRDSKGLAFIVLRDGTGILQCVVAEETVGNESFENAKRLPQESSISLTGNIVADDRQVGGVELQVTQLEIISESEIETFNIHTKSIERHPNFLPSKENVKIIITERSKSPRRLRSSIHISLTKTANFM